MKEKSATAIPVDVIDCAVQIVRLGTGTVTSLVHDGDEGIVVKQSQYVDQYPNATDQYDLEIVGVDDTHARDDHVSAGRCLAGEVDVLCTKRSR